MKAVLLINHGGPESCATARRPIQPPALVNGLGAESASLRDIYSRAEQFGLGLSPAEVGPALRLHYFDQPIGEFLHVGMKPITTWKGEPGIFVVANGGAGQILIGQNGSADMQMAASSAFLFVRPREPPALAKRHGPAAR